LNGRLNNLIRTLRELSAQIASRVLLGRITRQEGAKPLRSALQIRDLVADCVTEPCGGIGPAAEEAPAEPPGETRPPSQDPSPDSAATPPSKESSPSMFNDLSGLFARHRGQAGLDSLMAEKMRANTLDHLNRALILARRGEGEGARIHADLAETAMETAAKYMSEEEYRALEAEVERRLSVNAPPR
jgi:hypothetical protein